jgi:hypothetical protein
MEEISCLCAFGGANAFDHVSLFGNPRVATSARVCRPTSYGSYTLIAMCAYHGCSEPPYRCAKGKTPFRWQRGKKENCMGGTSGQICIRGSRLAKPAHAHTLGNQAYRWIGTCKAGGGLLCALRSPMRLLPLPSLFGARRPRRIKGRRVMLLSRIPASSLFLDSWRCPPLHPS